MNKFLNLLIPFALLSTPCFADKKPPQKPKEVKIQKKKRPTPPTRFYQDPAAPEFTLLTASTELKSLLNQNGNFVTKAPYRQAPEMKKNAHIPQGKIHQFKLFSKDGSIYNPGIARKVFGTPDPNNPNTLIVDTHEIDFERVITVYIPAQKSLTAEYPFMIVHDSTKSMNANLKSLNIICDNLIAQKRIPPMMIIGVANGGGDAQGHQRGKEYDTMSGLLAEYIETHVLPEVEKRYELKLTEDPNARAVIGVSSGASAALAMAWYRNDLYTRVVSFSGTFVNQQWPYNPETPGGAWEFHKSIIPNSPKKNIRIWLAVGDRDLLNPNVMRDGMHDWVEANHHMAKVLKVKNYDYQYFFCEENKHGMGPAKNQFMPHAIEWVWKDYMK
ncbi:alpha/beta hydrolase-fold protein [Lentisphaera profundi]|uniref:Alpha/beta hydrolase-fold protein n=1 Tax=Lentisphaera profundi TaxID=1658616 RepID=A0ABY7VMY0_9BACT|nr:alpha/beta hydrolase-fold protein [Lentisphaera profundi]WDE95420.1 alpha/beta hydrolase-fold protein [Lentisphaera profundi]